MIVDRVEIVLIAVIHLSGFPIGLLQVLLHPVYPCFQLFLLGCVPWTAEIQVEISFLFIWREQRSFYCGSVCFILTDAVSTHIFKSSPVFENDLADQLLHPFDHDHKIIAVLIHKADIRLAEIPPVQNESGLFISVSFGLLQHDLKLGHVNNASRILLVKQWLPVIPVIRNGIIEDRIILTVFWVPKLRDLNIPGLTGLVRWIIGNIDFFPMVSWCIPLVQETNTLILRDVGDEIWNFGITIYPHAGSKKRVVITVIGIVLSRIVLRNNGVRCQVKKKSAVPPDNPRHHLIQLIILNDIFDNYVSAYTQAATAIGPVFFFRKFHLRKIFDEVWIGEHLRRIIRIHLTNRCALGNIIPLFRDIFSAICVLHIGRSFSLIEWDSTCIFRDLNMKIEVHFLPLNKYDILLNKYNKYSPKNQWFSLIFRAF